MTDRSDVTGDAVVSIAVGGMTCGACAAKIERRLNVLDGVSASVNYASERARAALPVDLPVEKLVDEIRSAGYTAELVQDTAQFRGPPDEVDQAPALAPKASDRVGVALHAIVRLIDRLLARPVAALPLLAVASHRLGRPRSDLGRVALLYRRGPQCPTPHVHHGHPGVAGHRGRHQLVDLRHVLAGHRQCAPVDGCSCSFINRGEPSTSTLPPP